MKEELTDFLRLCAVERRLAPLTCSAYERDVSACLGYLQARGLADLVEVRPTHLRAFLAEDAKHRPAASSQARATAALKSFFRFLVDDEQLKRDPARPLRIAEAARGAAGRADDGGLDRLLAAPAPSRASRPWREGRPLRPGESHEPAQETGSEDENPGALDGSIDPRWAEDGLEGS